MRPRGGLPARSARVRGALRHRRGLSRLSGRAALAGTGSVAPTVGLSELGRCAKYGSNVLPAVAKRPSTAGTIFQDTRKPCGFGSEQCGTSSRRRTGVSALGLQRVLGLGQLPTAWAWMHKLRRAMVRPGRERLTGVVEVDETYWGAEEEGVRGRQIERKGLIAVAAGGRGSGLGADPYAAPAQRLGGQLDALRGGVDRARQRGSHRWLAGLRATREEGLSAPHRLPQGSPRAGVGIASAAVHKAISLLKRWLLGTHQGASATSIGLLSGRIRLPVQPRSSRSRGKLFYRLVQQAVAVEPTPYRSIIAHWDAEPF